MDDNGALRELYAQTVLDHSRHPRNFRCIPEAGRKAVGHNALCGDKISLYLHLDGDRIDDAAFEATGCAISVASASMLTEMVKGRRLTQAETLIRDVKSLFDSGNVDTSVGQSVGDIAALSRVRAYPSRVRCATLAWRTLQAAIDGSAGTVSTE